MSRAGLRRICIGTSASVRATWTMPAHKSTAFLNRPTADRDLEIFDGLGEFASPRLHLFEQPRVFNRNYGLVRKGIDELDLAFGERAHFGAPNKDHPNCRACMDQRHGERGAIVVRNKAQTIENHLK